MNATLKSEANFLILNELNTTINNINIIKIMNNINTNKIIILLMILMDV